MQLFQRLQVSTLPHVFILSASTAVDRERIKVKPEDTLKPDSYDKFPWTSDEFDAFLTEKTGIVVGKVHRTQTN